MVLIYKKFIGKIAGQKKLRSLTNANLAELTGYKKSTIEAFMCGARESESVAKALSDALGIKLKK